MTTYNNYYYSCVDENGETYFINMVSGAKKRFLGKNDVEVESDIDDLFD